VKNRLCTAHVARQRPKTQLLDPDAHVVLDLLDLVLVIEQVLRIQLLLAHFVLAVLVLLTPALARSLSTAVYTLTRLTSLPRHKQVLSNQFS